MLFIAEQNLLTAGYTYSDMSNMTVDEVLLRARILGRLEFLAESRSGGL